MRFLCDQTVRGPSRQRSLVKPRSGRTAYGPFFPSPAPLHLFLLGGLLFLLHCRPLMATLFVCIYHDEVLYLGGDSLLSNLEIGTNWISRKMFKVSPTCF